MLKNMKMRVKIIIIATQKSLKKGNNVLKYNHGEKYMKVLFIIYSDLESLLEKNRHLS